MAWVSSVMNVRLYPCDRPAQSSEYGVFVNVCQNQQSRDASAPDSASIKFPGAPAVRVDLDKPVFNSIKDQYLQGWFVTHFPGPAASIRAVPAFDVAPQKRSLPNVSVQRAAQPGSGELSKEAQR